MRQVKKHRQTANVKDILSECLMSEKTQSDKDTQQSESSRLTPFTALSTSTQTVSPYLIIGVSSFWNAKKRLMIQEKYICSVQKPFLWG